MGIRKPRPDYNPDVVERAICPGCALHLGGVIHPDCPVCNGAGTITLGQRALFYDPPEIVATAAATALNASLEAMYTGSPILDHHRAVIPATLAKLTALGILDPAPLEAPAWTPPPMSSLAPSTSPAPSSPQRARGTRRAWHIPGQLTLWPA